MDWAADVGAEGVVRPHSFYGECFGVAVALFAGLNAAVVLENSRLSVQELFPGLVEVLVRAGVIAVELAVSRDMAFWQDAMGAACPSCTVGAGVRLHGCSFWPGDV